MHRSLPLVIFGVLAQLYVCAGFATTNFNLCTDVTRTKCILAVPTTASDYTWLAITSTNPSSFNFGSGCTYASGCRSLVSSLDSTWNIVAYGTAALLTTNAGYWSGSGQYPWGTSYGLYPQTSYYSGSGDYLQYIGTGSPANVIGTTGTTMQIVCGPGCYFYTTTPYPACQPCTSNTYNAGYSTGPTCSTCPANTYSDAGAASCNPVTTITGNSPSCVASPSSGTLVSGTQVKFIFSQSTSCSLPSITSQPAGSSTSVTTSGSTVYVQLTGAGTYVFSTSGVTVYTATAT